MSKCKKCGLEINWIKKVGRWYGYNPDGTEHWDLCAETRNKGKTFKEKSSGVINGENCKPNHCDCGLPPWELCRPDCQWALNPATQTEMMDFDAMQHLKTI